MKISNDLFYAALPKTRMITASLKQLEGNAFSFKGLSMYLNDELVPLPEDFLSNPSSEFAEHYEEIKKGPFKLRFNFEEKTTGFLAVITLTQLLSLSVDITPTGENKEKLTTVSESMTENAVENSDEKTLPTEFTVKKAKIRTEKIGNKEHKVYPFTSYEAYQTKLSAILATNGGDRVKAFDQVSGDRVFTASLLGTPTLANAEPLKQITITV